MHEMSLMAGVFEIIENILAQHDVKRVTKVKLKVGELTNAEPSALKMAFAAYAQGGVCEGAELEIERVPVRGRCPQCDREFAVPGHLFLCPHCERNLQIIAGDELLLESLEVE